MAFLGIVVFVAFGVFIAWAWRYAGDSAAPERGPSNDAHAGWYNLHDGGG